VNPDELTHEGALLVALTAILNDDEALKARAHGAFMGKADTATPTPFLNYHISAVWRDSTFGGEAYRIISFIVKATWEDKNGESYAQGDRLINRVNWLLDGGARINDALQMERVQALLNQHLAPEGYYAMRCALETPLPMADEYLGDSKTGRFNMGTLFHAHLRKSGI
jgi:hypothetical protein